LFFLFFVFGDDVWWGGGGWGVCIHHPPTTRRVVWCCGCFDSRLCDALRMRDHINASRISAVRKRTVIFLFFVSQKIKLYLLLRSSRSGERSGVRAAERRPE
jgi:hypothetical protein